MCFQRGVLRSSNNHEAPVGDAVGDAVGNAVGNAIGAIVGDAVGAPTTRAECQHQ